MKNRLSGNQKGFTLVEVVVAMVVLALIAAPLGGALAVSARVNAYADRVLQARLAVSAAAETLLAEGVQAEKEEGGTAYTVQNVSGPVTVTAEAAEAGEAPTLFRVTITSQDVEDVSVSTVIHAAPGEDGP